MTDDTTSWDAIVVGGGLGGLTCAAYLAVAGRRVLVLEQHDRAGGNSHVFRRRRVYEFDVGVHYIGDCGPGGVVPAILSGLGAGDRVRFHELDPDGFDRIELPGLAVDVPAGWAAYRDRLHRALPGDRAGLDVFLGVCRAVAGERRGSLLAPGGLPGGDWTSGTAALREWGRRPLGELLDHCALSVRARTVLAAQSPNYGLGPGQATVSTHATVTDHYLRGAYYPVGGGQMLAAALVEVIEAHGGELRTRSRVARIDIAGRTVTGVTLADGRSPAAPLVVSNADYRRTVLELAGPGHFSANVVARTRDAAMALPFVTLYVGLDRELPPRREANLWWYDTDDVESLYRELEEGRPAGRVRSLFISFSSLKSPGGHRICPPGHANFQLMTLCPRGYAPWGVTRGPAEGGRYRRDAAYLARKAQLTEAMLRAGERAIGPFRDHITHLEPATPLSQERYTLSTGGTPYGLARWGAPGARPNTATGVTGLHVVGQSTRYGSGVAGVMTGGVMCAAGILGRALMPEVYGGAVLGDPGLLPVRGAGWDPLAVSLGRRGGR
ncbi:phytoene desaturase family protein [Streptomyces jumonjinensis]|uniref:NAD(P)/FAD-dependent oxidoreductase n=1 Tax=Streptomyces jumonjinensis TaxID=1945 RepID=A0A646KLL5_STRJU|nr:NAD(P)/FAD-dependent oxidoreductase [Streptomyces jumonjinensis]MQT03214.1 NAD(P)/FAD-dependent oxidoreductase [Streptomyces jumonjinensis]